MEQWRKNLYTLVTTQICCMVGFGLVMPFIAFYFSEMGMKVGSRLDFMGQSCQYTAGGGHGYFLTDLGSSLRPEGKKIHADTGVRLRDDHHASHGTVSSVGPFLVLVCCRACLPNDHGVHGICVV